MDTLGVILSALFWAALIIVLIYLVLRRISIKEKEDFDKRDN